MTDRSLEPTMVGAPAYQGEYQGKSRDEASRKSPGLVAERLKRFSGGAGLGLPLARALARSQSSELQLVSELGKGTEVRAYFPLISSPSLEERGGG